MKKYTLYALMLTLMGLAGCTDVVDVELEKSEPLLVIDGWITDQPGPYTIRLTTTAPYFDNKPTPRVAGAAVTISDGAGQHETLVEQAPGIYQTRHLRGRIGGQYTLAVKVQGEEYRAQTAITRTFSIDSAGTVFKKEQAGFKEGFYATLYGREPQGVGDAYRLKVFRNDTLLNRPQDLVFLDDQYIDGNYFSGFELGPGPFRKGDRLRIENHSLTRDALEYYISLYNAMQNNGGLFSNPPTNLRTNIRNVNPAGKKAIGWFGGSAVQQTERVIQ